MRILYGVVGEGMGHAMRSGVILDHLTKNHEVQVVVSGRAHDYLVKRASERLSVRKIWGLNIVYEDNEVQSFRTVLANLKGAVTGMPKNVRAYFDIAEKFAPDVVISDFESWSYLFGKNHLLPVLSRRQHPDLQPLHARARDPRRATRTSSELAKTVVQAEARRAAFHYLITTFFYPPMRKPRTTLAPPILRPEILAAERGQGDHLLVYQTSTSNTALPEILARSGLRVPHLRPAPRPEGGRRRGQPALPAVQRGRLHRRPAHRARRDRQRRLHADGRGGLPAPPMLAVPLDGQFEQVLNARYLEAEGYGLGADELTSERLSEFLERLPDFERRARRLQPAGQRRAAREARRSAAAGGRVARDLNQRAGAHAGSFASAQPRHSIGHVLAGLVRTSRRSRSMLDRCSRRSTPLLGSRRQQGGALSIAARERRLASPEPSGGVRDVLDGAVGLQPRRLGIGVANVPRARGLEQR